MGDSQLKDNILLTIGFILVQGISKYDAVAHLDTWQSKER